MYYTKSVEIYCVKKKNTPNEKSSSRKIKQKRLMSLSNCAARGKKEQI